MLWLRKEKKGVKSYNHAGLAEGQKI